MIKEIAASLWLDETETTATAYININDSKDSIYFTFDLNDQVDGKIKSHRVRSKSTRKTVKGITATLKLPSEPSTGVVPFRDYVLTVQPEGEEQCAVTLKQCKRSFFEDGTRNYRRPIADGRYTNDGVSFAKWFSDNAADSDDEVAF